VGQIRNPMKYKIHRTKRITLMPLT